MSLKWSTVSPIYVQSVGIGCIILMWNCPLTTTYNVQYSVGLKNKIDLYQWIPKKLFFPKLDSSSMKSAANHECRLILLLLHKNKTKWSLQWHSKLGRISLIGIAYNCFRNSFWRSIDVECSLNVTTCSWFYPISVVNEVKVKINRWIYLVP